MTQIIIGQVRFLLVTMCLGMALMAGYEILHFCRWMHRHAKWTIWMEDILYWCIMAVPAYILFYFYNDGTIRWYGALSVLCGGILYEKGIGRPLRKLLNRLLWKPRKRLKIWFGKVKNRIHIKFGKILRRKYRKNVAKKEEIVYSKRTK